MTSLKKAAKETTSVRNLGVILDPCADMENHIKKMCKTCHVYLPNTSQIRTYLDRESTEAIMHAFVTTNLDYGNAILYRLPKVILNRLQLVQNRAARIVRSVGGGGGSRGSNEPPLQVNGGGLKTQAVIFSFYQIVEEWKKNFECFSSV